MTKQLLIWTKK